MSNTETIPSAQAIEELPAAQTDAAPRASDEEVVDIFEIEEIDVTPAESVLAHRC